MSSPLGPFKRTAVQFTQTKSAITTLVAIGDPVVARAQARVLYFEVANLGANLTDFEVLTRPTPDATPHILKSSTDWATQDNVLIWAQGSLNTLATGAKLSAMIAVDGVYDVLFKASAGGATVVTLIGNLTLDRK